MPQDNKGLLTSDELQMLLQPKTGVPTSPPNPSYNYPSAGEWVKNLGVGAAKGLGQTIEGGGQMIRRYLPFMNSLPEVQLPINVNPSNYQQNVGAGLEHAGEFMLGAGRVPFTAIPQGLMAAGLAGAHTGGDPESMIGTGVTAGLIPPFLNRLAKTAPGQAYAVLKQWVQSKMATPQAGISGGTSSMPGIPAATNTVIKSISAPAPPPQGSPAVPQLGAGRIIQQPGQPQGQIGGSTSPQLALPPAPSGPPQLGAAPGGIVPRGAGADIPPSPDLPAHYNVPVKGPEPPPGTFGGLQLGQEGGIPARGEQTATGIKVHSVVRDAETGKFRKLTDQEMDQWIQQHGTAGKTVTEPSPEPPKSPRKAPLKK